MSTALYCNRHKTIERLTGRQVEDLISGLRVELADAECRPSHDFTGYTDVEVLNDWCPTGRVATYRDEELFADFMTDTRGERLAAARRARDEYRRVGGGVAPRMRVPDPRGDGVRRAAALLLAGFPVGQVAAVLREAGKAYAAIALRHLGPVDQIGVDRLVSMLPESAELAGQVVELPTAPARTEAEDFEDQVDREAGLPLRERTHRGQIDYETGLPCCSVCGWSPVNTAHVRTTREAAQAIRRAHNPNGRDD